MSHLINPYSQRFLRDTPPTLVSAFWLSAPTPPGAARPVSGQFQPLSSVSIYQTQTIALQSRLLVPSLSSE